MPPKKAVAKVAPAVSSRGRVISFVPHPPAPESPKKKPAASKTRRGNSPPNRVYPNLAPKPVAAAAPEIESEAEEEEEEEEAEEELEGEEKVKPVANQGAARKKAPATYTKKAPAAKKEKAPAVKNTVKYVKTAAKKAAAADGDEPAKRPVGRPKKAAAADGDEPAKRPVGRPKKDTSESAAASKANGKRKASDSDNEDEDAQPKAKKAKTAAGADRKKQGPVPKPKPAKPAKPEKAAKPEKPEKAAKPEKPAKPAKVLKVINEAPTQRLNIFVCGENSAGELGLGHMKQPDGKVVTDVRRPRLNYLLDAKKVGVVAIAVGGMHCIAITHDNKILTWGVNDQGTLGRDTKKEVVEGDDDADSSDDADDSGLNPLESTPGEVDNKYFAEGTKFVQVAASDSASFVLTADGSVYGWGTFRGNDGIIGFTPDITECRYPIKIEPLAKIKCVVAGANHVMALSHTGATYGWGAGEQSQLGRRTVERTRKNALYPREFGLPSKGKNKIKYLSCGSFHTFAIDTQGNVWSWGMNNFAQTGFLDRAGEEDAYINKPAIVESLAKYSIKEIKGGNHHSIACTDDGKVLTWGRIDGHQIGIEIEDLDEESVMRYNGKPRILKVPTVVPDIHGVQVTAGSDTSIAIDNDGKAYSWGFSTNYQTGQGTTEDVEEATLLDNSAVRDEKIVWAGLGGQFAVFTSVAEDVPEVNDD